MKKRHKLILGNNITELKKLPENSIDSVVTDPPYGLSFMNKKWDYDVPSVEFWREIYRVLKPGGHILSFGGTRTYHRMVVNIEDAGFEIRDQIMWLYGSGFPKSHNIGKAVDKIQGNEREVVGSINQPRMNNDFGKGIHNERQIKELELTKGTSEYEGWGTALKPANEPICLARKPLSEKSVGENVLKWQTGGLNIDGCRIGTDEWLGGGGYNNKGTSKKDLDDATSYATKVIEGEFIQPEGRFPANIILECICDDVIKGEKGEVKKSSGSRKGLDITHEWGYGEINRTTFTDKGDIHTDSSCPCAILDGQSAGASRFFYVAKVSKTERNMGLDGFEEKKKWLKGGGGSGISDRENVVAKNNHPTVKPINLMTYLCRLITPKNGIILDPFMGSGSTGVSALLEDFRFVGIELDSEYMKIAESRIENFEKYRPLIKN